MIRKTSYRFILPFIFALVFGMYNAYASETGDSHVSFAQTFLWLGIILLISKLGSIVEKFKFPAVLGELTAGIVIGNLALAHIEFFEPMKTDLTLRFLAELGVVLLLFQVGLESNVAAMKKIGIKALVVALIGVALPFVLGTYVVAPFLFNEGTPQQISNASLFLGATLTATSVGITARVFKDLSALSTPEAGIILGAAVIDDIIGLIILSVVQSIVQTGSIELFQLLRIIGTSIAFLGGGLIIGQYIGRPAAQIIAWINNSAGSKLGFALMICLVFAYCSHLVGLAPIVGAFTAGLVLDEVFFKSFDGPSVIPKITSVLGGKDDPIAKEVSLVLEEHSGKHLEEIVEPLGHFLVPVFFIIVGLDVRLDVLLNPTILLTALSVTAVAVIGKLLSGFVAGKGVNRLLIGWGMVPRGEVGLIFASAGKKLGVVNDELFSIIVIVVIMTTLITPPVLSSMIRKRKLL